ncbi:MAG: ABC transporter ATP-binding protein [Oscillospiraceae bacterium]
MSLIEMNGIRKKYVCGGGIVNALDNISLSVEEGEFISVVGTSGSGKSTLMNMLGCLDLPDGGEYYLDGRNVFSMNDRELSEIRNEKIGFIFQGFNLIGELSAIENVELPLLYRKIPRDERRYLAENALKRVFLEKRMNHRPSELSGGQQQRVAIARALAARPRIILADEPTGSLDSNSGREVMNFLSELNKEGKTVIIITHDNAIANRAKRIIRICDGKIAQ